MKHTIAALFRCLAVIALFMAAPAGAEAGERTLYIYTWNDYFDSEVINLFQQSFDCRVEMGYFSSNEAMYESLAAGGGGYDIVTPSSYMSSIMYRDGLLLPLDHARIPNLAHIDRESVPETEDPDFVYSVPYTISVSGVCYDIGRVDAEDIGGWDIFANPKYRGRMTLINDQRETMGAALRHLGYSANSTDDAQLEAARRTLLEWRGNLSSFLDDDVTLELNPRTRVVSHAYSGDAALAISENDNLGFYVPREGSTQAVDDFVVMADAENPDLAHAFINFLLDPDIASRNMEGIFFFMPNSEALLLVDPELRSNPAFNLSHDALMRCEALRDLGDDGEKYETIWNEVAGGEG